MEGKKVTFLTRLNECSIRFISFKKRRPSYFEADNRITPHPDFSLGPSWAAAIAFLVPAVIYFVYRIYLFPIINSDAAYTFYDYHNNIDVNIFSVFASKYHQHNFRPLDILLWSNVADLYSMYGEKYHRLVVLGVACLNGLLSLTIYGICFNYCKSKITSLFASFLYAFSLTGICGTWHNLFAAFMLGPLLLTCGAIFAYQKFHSLTSKRRWFWLGVLILFCIVAPWFREVGYMPAVVVFILELLRVIHQRSLFFLVPGALTAHAMMPKVIPSLMGLYEGPVKILGAEGHASMMSIANLNHIVSGLIINEIPPLLYLLIVIPVIAYSSVVIIPQLLKRSYWKQQFTPLNMMKIDESGKSEKVQLFSVKILGLCLGVVISVLLLLLIHPVFNVDLGMSEKTEQIFPTFFLLAVSALTALRFGVLFPVWFIFGAILPMMLGSGQELHNCFAMPALAIICALYSRQIIKAIANIRVTVIRQFSTGVVTLVLVLVGVDHVSNVPTSYLNLNNINIIHQEVASWLVDNVSEGSYVFTDFYAANDIMYRTSYPKDKYDFRPIPYDFRSAPSVQVQLDLIKDARIHNRQVFYIHLRKFSTDVAMMHPKELIVQRKTFNLNILTLGLDPLRFATDSKKYPRRFAPNEWDTSYGWVGYGANPCAWPVEIIVYELPMDKVTDIDASSFINIRPEGSLREWGWGPKITSIDGVNIITGWKNNKDTAIIPYEEFISKGAENIIRAVNKSGIGVANTPGFEMKSGKHYQVTFVMTKTSGAYPSFRISEDPYGNTSPLVYSNSDGPMTYVFEVPKSRIYYSVFRVEDEEQTDFSVSSFSLKEITGIKE